MKKSHRECAGGRTRTHSLDDDTIDARMKQSSRPYQNSSCGGKQSCNIVNVLMEVMSIYYITQHSYVIRLASRKACSLGYGD